MSCTKLLLTALLLLVASSGCTVNVPGKVVPSTAPIDTAKRINTVGKEAIGESCQWWLSIGFAGNGIVYPLWMEGNQNYLAVKDALAGQYDGLVGAITDNRTTYYGLALPTQANPDPNTWARFIVTSVCQEIRGQPFVYTQPIASAVLAPAPVPSKKK